MINSFSGDSERCVLERNLLHGLWAWFTFSSYVDTSVLNINEFRNNPVSFSSFSSTWVLLIRTELSASNTEDGAEAWKPIRLLPSKIYYVKEESRVTASTWISFLKLIGSLHPSGWIVQSDRGAPRHQRESRVATTGTKLVRRDKLQFYQAVSDLLRGCRRKHTIFMCNRGGLIAEVCRTRPLPSWQALRDISVLPRQKKGFTSLPFCSSLAFSCLSKLFAHFWTVLQQTERQRDVKGSDRKVSRNPGEKSQTNLILLR